MKAKWLLKKIGTAIYDNRANIEFVVGTSLVVVGTGMAIAKAEDAVEVKYEMERQIKEIELRDEDDGWETNGERTKACLTMAKTTAVGYAKVYALPLGIEIAGIALQSVSHATSRSEVAAATSALTSLATQFYNYRERVKEEIGEDKEEKIYLGVGKEVVNEDGSFSTTDLPIAPPHTFIFDESNVNYEKTPGANRDFLDQHLFWLNDRLWREGILWENDIRRDVGAPIDPEATNWGITAVDEDGNRNYISFGMEKNTERAQAFRDGLEQSFWITLNMEPNISKKMYRLDKYRNEKIK